MRFLDVFSGILSLTPNFSWVTGVALHGTASAVSKRPNGPALGAEPDETKTAEAVPPKGRLRITQLKLGVNETLGKGSTENVEEPNSLNCMAFHT
jgi:hypothetical protein